MTATDDFESDDHADVDPPRVDEPFPFAPDGDGAAGELAAVIGSVTDLADRHPSTLTGGQRRDLAVTLAEAKDRLEALLTSAIGAVDSHSDHAPSGSRSAAAWLAARSELPKQQAASLIGMNRDLDRYDDLRTAWRHGRIGTSKIRLLLKAARHVESQMERDQAFLVDTIEPLTAHHAAIAIGRWREHALAELDSSPDDPEPEPVRNSLTTKAGANREHVLAGTLDRRSGHEFERLLKAEIEKGFATGDYTADDGLEHTERRADALLRLMRRGLETKTEFGRLRPSTVNLVDLAALLGLSSRQVRDLCLRPRETEDGTVLSAYELLDDLTQGNLTNVLGFYGIEGRFHPIGTITTNRLADAAQRRLLQIRDGNCMHPGCDQPAHRCVPHHEPPFEQTGHTTVHELVLLCRYHHKLRHEGTNHYDLGDHGDLTITTPEGHPLPNVRPGRKIGRRRGGGRTGRRAERRRRSGPSRTSGSSGPSGSSRESRRTDPD